MRRCPTPLLTLARLYCVCRPANGMCTYLGHKKLKFWIGQLAFHNSRVEHSAIDLPGEISNKTAYLRVWLAIEPSSPEREAPKA